MKTCSKCNVEKALDEFNKKKAAKDGRRPECRPCQKTSSRGWVLANKERKAASTKAWNSANKERIAATCKAWREANKERDYAASKVWYEANKERKAAIGRVWNKENPDKKSAAGSRYRAAKLRRTPSWSNPEPINELYTQAVKLRELTGIKFHVDHIVPLQGELVSGLHVEGNLQLLTAYENLTKSNKHQG